MKFNRTTTLIYKNCITRISNKLNELKKPQITIFPDDKSLVSTFFNYFDYPTPPKNNPYLLPPCLVHRNKSKKNKNLPPSGIHITLGMEIFEILWGKKDDEFIRNLPSIFVSLLYDIYEKDSTVNKDIIDLVLCDYVPYAKYLSLSHIENKNALVSRFGVYDFKTEDNYIHFCFDSALRFLYAKEDFRIDFENTFKKFAKTLNSYTRLPKKLEKFSNNEFIELFKRHIPSSASLGLRVKTLIENDFSHTEQLFKHLSNKDFNAQDCYVFELNKASSLYITELERIQSMYLDDTFSDVWEF